MLPRVLLASLAFFLLLIAASAQSAPPEARHQAPDNAPPSKEKTPTVSPDLARQWRKYGPNDFRAQASKFRDYTLYNFGNMGAAAGFDQDALLALVRASAPTQEQVEDLADTRLREDFLRNLSGLETLRAMAEEDSHVVRIAADFTWLDSTVAWPRPNLGFSNERWDSYKALFKKLSLPEGLVRDQDFPGAIFFIAESHGRCVGGLSAGYVYSPGPLSPDVDFPKEGLIAAIAKSTRQNAIVFQHLKDNWYAFYEADW